MKTMQQKKYNFHLTIAFLLYASGLTLTILLKITPILLKLEQILGHTLALVILILPFLFGLLYLAVVATYGFVHQDEMLKSISTRALSVGFLVGGLFSLGYGALEIIAGFPSLNGMIYWTFMGFAWAIAHIIILKRYQ